METLEPNKIFLLKKEALSVCERQPWPLGCVCEGGLHCIMSGLHYGLLGSCRRIGSSASCLMDCAPSNCLNVYVKTLPYSPVRKLWRFSRASVLHEDNNVSGCKWTKKKKNEINTETNEAKNKTETSQSERLDRSKMCHTDVETLAHGLIAAVAICEWLWWCFLILW